MKFYPKVIKAIARDVIQKLTADKDIEVETLRISAAEEDMEAIMREYVAMEERVNAATREAMERRKCDASRFSQIKREMADVRGFKSGDEGIDFIINQMLEFLLVSRNVEEVFSDDPTMRRKINLIIRKHLTMDEEIDREARNRLKHLQEGTSAWDIEYRKTVEQLRRAKGLFS